jgi:DNA-binding SARP family transcriptional activator
MAALHLKVLGGFAAVLSTGQQMEISGKKNQALLTYLALRPDKRLTREKLVSLLWSDRGEAQARTSLRQALAALRRALDGIAPPPLTVDRDIVALDGSAISTDVAAFEKLAASASAEELRRAAKLYEGDLLDGLAVHDPAFDDWLTFERNRLREAAIGALTRLMAHLNATEAIATGQRLVALDPLREASHQALMHAYAAQGQFEQAIRQHHYCRDTLRRELDVAPSAEMENLHREIKEGKYLRQPVTSSAEAGEPVPSLAARLSTSGARQTASPDALLVPARQPSIAVLALANLSGDPANDQLCDGIVDDIITGLSRFRNLMVIARRSSFLFSLKSNPAREIGHCLGIRYLLSGNLRRAGKRMRIGVELIDAESEAVLWSDHFCIDGEELFDLQDEITGTVAARLAVQIDFADRQHESQCPRDMRAYSLVLRGYQLIQQYAKEANAHARRLFEEAIGIAPEYGCAYRALSRTHNLDWRYSWSAEPDRSLNTAVDLARRAVHLDPLDARGYAELGFAYLYKQRHDESIAEYLRALAMNPNDAAIIAEYADCLVYVGQPQKSVELMEKAMRLNPYYPDWYLWYLADAYCAMGKPAKVIATVQRMQNPDEGRRMLAASFAELDMMDEARNQAEKVMRLHPEFSISRWRHRPPYQDKAALERFMEGLRRAGLPE